MIKAGPVNIMGYSPMSFGTSSASNCMKRCDADPLCQVCAMKTVQYGSALKNFLNHYNFLIHSEYLLSSSPYFL